MPTYREIYLEKDEAPAQPSLEDLLQRETEDEDACHWLTLTTSSSFICVAVMRAAGRPPSLHFRPSREGAT